MKTKKKKKKGTASEACLTVAVAARERSLRYEGIRSWFKHHHQALDHHHETKAELSQAFVDQPEMTATQRGDLTKRMVIYGTTQTHSMGQKSAKILGLQWRGLPVFKQDGWGLRGETLRRALEADVAEGLIPCMLGE